MKEIVIAMVDDWELRGTGVGNVIENQVKPMRVLMSLYEKYNIRGTFNVEVMQQLYMRKFQGRFPELKTQADAWDSAVIDALNRGHDVQLHIHPQWLNASYNTENGWELNCNWDITQYDKEDVEGMFRDSIEYLKILFRNNNIEHRLCSYRAGSWAFAPSEFMLSILEENNIVLDMSLVKGLKYDTKHVKLDYTVMEESRLPYYPVHNDARFVSNKREKVVCIPTFRYKCDFYAIFIDRVKEILYSKNNKAVAVSSNWATYNEWGGGIIR